VIMDMFMRLYACACIHACIPLNKAHHYLINGDIPSIKATGMLKSQRSYLCIKKVRSRSIVM
jgi:hypothetical protein